MNGLPNGPKPKKEKPDQEKVAEDVISQLKVNGLFDQFRKECVSEVDKQPSYLNLQSKVAGTVDTFLKGLTWTPGFPKLKMREIMRKEIEEAPYFANGLDSIVDETLGCKLDTIFKPLIEKEVFRMMGCTREEYQEKIRIKLQKSQEKKRLKLQRSQEKERLKLQISQELQKIKHRIQVMQQPPNPSNEEEPREEMITSEELNKIPDNIIPTNKPSTKRPIPQLLPLTLTPTIAEEATTPPPKKDCDKQNSDKNYGNREIVPCKNGEKDKNNMKKAMLAVDNNRRDSKSSDKTLQHKYSKSSRMNRFRTENSRRRSRSRHRSRSRDRDNDNRNSYHSRRDRSPEKDKRYDRISSSHSSGYRKHSSSSSSRHRSYSSSSHESHHRHKPSSSESPRRHSFSSLPHNYSRSRRSSRETDRSSSSTNKSEKSVRSRPISSSRENRDSNNKKLSFSTADPTNPFKMPYPVKRSSSGIPKFVERDRTIIETPLNLTNKIMDKMPPECDKKDPMPSDLIIKQVINCSAQDKDNNWKYFEPIPGLEEKLRYHRKLVKIQFP